MKKTEKASNIVAKKKYIRKIKSSLKTTKSFHVQKLIRKLKEEQRASKREEKIKELAEKIRILKNLDLNQIATDCLKNENIIMSDENSDRDGAEKSKEELSLVKLLLSHERFRATIKEIKFTEKLEKSSNNRKVVKPSKNENKPLPSLSFVESLSRKQVSNQEVEVEEENEFQGTFNIMLKKKNRPGQRSRHAKKLAIENKAKGKTWDSSLNWRGEKKEKKEEVEVRANDVANNGQEWKKHDHPSWLAAKRKKKESILPFQGTKITF